MRSHLMRTPPILFLISLAAACYHPLEITGEGDIESSTGTNDCALEDQPCANHVTGDYIVTYSANPRPDWTFMGWEGCFEPPPTCSFNVPASTVALFAGQTMPPLRAVFAQPITLNDTGVTFGGEALSGNNPGCTGATIAQQDCSSGRDSTHNDDSDGHAGFSFTKLDFNGVELPASAADWACVRDNVTGLVWELKTDDGGIHDKDNNYRWGGKTAQGVGHGTYFSDWDVLVDGSNNEALCGFSDWRVPTRVELLSIVDFSASYPAIDTAYFPNTYAAGYWLAVPTVSSSGFNYGRTVDFALGYSYQARRNQYRPLRLVRAEN